jgi:hypothetical protein
MTRVLESAVGGDGVVGREAEVARIHEWVNAVACDGAALHIVGEAGIGKTALLDLAADTAVAAGFSILVVRGTHLPGHVDLAGLDAVLAPVRHRIGELAPHDGAALSVALGMGDGPAPTCRSSRPR